MPVPDFNDTKIAFASRTDKELRFSWLLFKSMGYPWLVKAGQATMEAAFSAGIPIDRVVKNTLFKQFCGGETKQECIQVVDKLYQSGIGSILDYSVEGSESESDFDQTALEIMETIEVAAASPLKIPFSVFKVTGIARFDLLSKISEGKSLTVEEQQEYESVKQRMLQICKYASEKGVRVLVDAEESWIQPAIDQLADEMMEQFNKESPIVYNTVQLYLRDGLAKVKQTFESAVEKGYYPGLKLVRGAYMEKERARAAAMGYPDPVQPDKLACDNDYNDALRFCIEQAGRMSICAGTHNEESCRLLAALILEKGMETNDQRIWFSQLFGMSDNLSFNLAHSGYLVAKYLPYGPVKSVLPYLFRRAQENTSVKGQAGRELSLIEKELERRKA